ncbi:MAG: 16S rRNA (cytidine(1402)-2'-O)-methyltransferase [Pseudomonadota bacterium]|nr:16S rRNA (cytidine(1402)-2'-O)-methyltransferase [Pseudomonadota bacterium]
MVATPIGNAGDLSQRANAVLSAADIVACEDTRVSGRLFAMHGIDASLTPYHDHNATKQRLGLIKRMKDGQSVALVSDAGTPAIADPGYKLVTAAIAEGLTITAVPGANAGLTALILSGLPPDRYLFAGYLPPRSAARRRVLSELAAVPATLVFQESNKRLAASLANMADILGARDAAVGRELTKLHEEMRRGSLASLAAEFKVEGPPKGEIVVVVAGPVAAPKIDDADLDRMIRGALAGLSVRDAAEMVTAQTGLPRKSIYSRALKLKAGDR